MKTANLVFVRILPLFVLSCQSAPTPTGALISGQSHADAVLQKDTIDIISVYVMAGGCNRIDHIDTAVLHYDPRTGEKVTFGAKNNGWLQAVRDPSRSWLPTLRMAELDHSSK